MSKNERGRGVEIIKSMVRYSWMLVAIGVAYAVYQIFSVTHWLPQILIGIVVGLVVVFTYAVVLVWIDFESL